MSRLREVQCHGGRPYDPSKKEPDIITASGLTKLYQPRTMGTGCCGLCGLCGFEIECCACCCAQQTPPSILAVNDVWMGVPKGQCFGLLGKNGAGKTSMIRMLTGEVKPSGGFGVINGNDMVSDPISARRYIGLCPQDDPLIYELTGREHLMFFGMLKGVPLDELEEIVEALIDALNLQLYADKPAGYYSGGNKRKLCAGLALVGAPPVVFMDEPSTGVDPGARRHMWNFITATMRSRALVLTTHSMEESEALSNRIGIMRGGVMAALGTPQHLKAMFPAGYQLTFNCSKDKLHQLEMSTFKTFPKCTDRCANDCDKHTKMLEKTDSAIKFQISQGHSLANIFRFGHDMKKYYSQNKTGMTPRTKSNFVDFEYSITQTTLEQVFLYLCSFGDGGNKSMMIQSTAQTAPVGMQQSIGYSTMGPTIGSTIVTHDEELGCQQAPVQMFDRRSMDATRPKPALDAPPVYNQDAPMHVPTQSLQQTKLDEERGKFEEEKQKWRLQQQKQQIMNLPVSDSKPTQGGYTAIDGQNSKE